MPQLIATALTGVTLAVLPSAHAHAHTPPLAAPGAELRLILTSSETRTSSTRTALLTCDPDGGTHPSAKPACRELTGRNGKIERDPGDTACTLIYAPVVAEAEGHWKGRIVRSQREYPNDCVMRAHTGKVFSF